MGFCLNPFDFIRVAEGEGWAGMFHQDGSSTRARHGGSGVLFAKSDLSLMDEKNSCFALKSVTLLL